MAAVVIDAPIASAWCFPDEQTDYTRAVFQAIFSSAVDSVAPRLWAYEIRNSVLMGIRRGRITKPDSEQFLVSRLAERAERAPPQYGTIRGYAATRAPSPS